MKPLKEALSKSMIKKLEKHNNILTEFTKKDLENGDLIIKKIGVETQIWMFLSNKEMLKRLNEFWKLGKDLNLIENGIDFIVYPDGTYWGLYRTPISKLKEKDGHLYFDVNGANVIYNKLIKTHGKFLNDNLSIKEIYQNNNYFKDFLTEK